MGSGSSRMSRRSSRARVIRGSRSSSHSFFSCLICGGSSSRASLQMENYPDEIQVNSAKRCDLITGETWSPAEEYSLISYTGTESTTSFAEAGASSGSKSTASEGPSAEDDFRNTEANNQGKCLSESKELVAPYQVSENYDHGDFCRNSSGEASTSVKSQEFSDSVSVNGLANKDAANGIDNSENNGVTQICRDDVHPSSSSSLGLGHSNVDGASIETPMEESTGVFNSDNVPQRSDDPVTFHSIGDESLQEIMPSGLGFLVANREQGQGDESMLHVDVVSISSSILSSSNADTSSRDARRNSRRLFWDAFSRRSSRRHLDSPTIVFATDGADDLLSHDRWLLDFSGDMLNEGIGSDSGYLGSRIHSLSGRRRHSRSEVHNAHGLTIPDGPASKPCLATIWERIRDGLDEHSRRTTLCPSGLHPDGMCSCESFPTTEETSTHASVSRIVMLAEALFEVLDEIHRQPVSLSLSMVSLPAPESIVDSFPLKNHKEEERVEGSDVEQCYICLSEYEEGDKIRVLPCHHEYHMSCVDKWLKEIHGVCPLCRGDVRQGANNPSVSCSESSVPSSQISSV